MLLLPKFVYSLNNYFLDLKDVWHAFQGIDLLGFLFLLAPKSCWLDHWYPLFKFGMPTFFSSWDFNMWPLLHNNLLQPRELWVVDLSSRSYKRNIFHIRSQKKSFWCIKDLLIIFIAHIVLKFPSFILLSQVNFIDFNLMSPPSHCVLLNEM